MNWQKLIGLCALLGMALWWTSCGKNYVMEIDYPQANNEWGYSDTLDFAFEIKDNSKKYNIFIDLSHAMDYGTQNMYINIYTKFPSGNRLSKMVSLELANKAGEWFGNCNSEWCGLRIPVQMGTTFPDPGNYVITLEQFTRSEQLAGVQSVGMAVEMLE